MSEERYYPAFPTTINREIVRGMTLRDYFAAAVLPVVYTAYVEDGYPNGYPKFEEIAKDAYELADAMLIARKQE
jgi:hypothetical protein